MISQANSVWLKNHWIRCEPVYYRALEITSRKHMTKHFRMAKKDCAQWQLNGS